MSPLKDCELDVLILELRRDGSRPRTLDALLELRRRRRDDRLAASEARRRLRSVLNGSPAASGGPEAR